MKIPGIDATAIDDRMQAGALLITATSQQESDWKRRLVAASAGVCATPRVCAWPAWLSELVSGMHDIPVPLDAMQEAWLWERVIRADGLASAASARGLARHAAEAYACMCEYHIVVDELAGGGEESEALARWIAVVRSEAARLGRCLAAEQLDLLCTRISRECVAEGILLDGFDAFTPAQAGLLQALQEGGVELARVLPSDAIAKPTLSACIDPESECRHAAQRIAARITAEPAERIAIVTSRQVNDSRLLSRVLDEELLPDGMAVAGVQAAVMNGEPLSDCPLAAQMLRLLQLAGARGAPFAEVSPLLFSPGLKGFAAERTARARLDAELRESNRHYVGFKTLLAMPAMQHMPELASVIKALIVWDTAARQAGEWVRAVHSLLQQAGYLAADVPGRTSHDIRVLNMFRECLASTALLDAVAASMEWRVFISQLAAACRVPLSGQVYLPRLSVLPLSCIAGLRFDAVYALGFDEEALPLPLQPVPLLPFAVQRRHGLPGSSAALAFTESEHLWRELCRAAPEVHVSYARTVEQRQLHASPLLAGIEARTLLAESTQLDLQGRVSFDDAPGVPVRVEEVIRGGSAIVKNQSACPFRAFATHRLGLSPLGETSPGIEAKDKGSLLHAALEYIWTHIPSQAALLALEEEQLRKLITDAVVYAWDEAGVSVAATIRDFEQRRMHRVLLEWLEVESTRPAFSVEQCEKEYRLHLPEQGDVRFRVWLKADRIDRDIDGRKLLIDYKSGRKQSVGEWIGERMAEPQLPLYSMAEGLGEHDAVCFARVRSGDMEFEGLSGEATGIRKIGIYNGKDKQAEDWPALLDVWRQRINNLAGEFVEGRCEVAPRDAKACRYCGLEAVCRIDEIGIVDDDMEEGDGA